mmetsp:Transcript_28633/g.78653  ORF Transcript_28633/g.78653 Transcript_28633/m.78653 type:complete len:234 (-) Transcript_28633:1104-1805(-)
MPYLAVGVLNFIAPWVAALPLFLVSCFEHRLQFFQPDDTLANSLEPLVLESRPGAAFGTCRQYNALTAPWPIYRLPLHALEGWVRWPCSADPSHQRHTTPRQNQPKDATLFVETGRPDRNKTCIQLHLDFFVPSSTCGCLAYETQRCFCICFHTTCPSVDLAQEEVRASWPPRNLTVLAGPSRLMLVDMSVPPVFPLSSFRAPYHASVQFCHPCTPTASNSVGLPSFWKIPRP